MSAALRILSAGPGVTLQDGGRHSYLRFGITVAGPMDPLAFAAANRAVDAPAGAAAIEVSVGGVEVTAEGATVPIAIAGGAFTISLDGRRLPPATFAPLEPGARLSIRAGQWGAWCYFAVGGRIDVAPTLGSVSTHTRSGLGGIDGRALRAGDVLPLRRLREAPARCEIVAPWLDRPSEVIRVVLGPQDDYFSPDQIATFFEGQWTLSARRDRMAYFLEGSPLRHAKGFDIVSDGIAMGAVQVPGSGQPIVLMADRQPTGGYPKIANVISVDLGRLAQLRPGARFRFAKVTVAEAQALRRAEAAVLAAPITLQPLVRAHPPSEALLGVNLIDGVTDGSG